eukprot:14501565-Ditylum_brightwellii.AAC.1
MIVPLPHIGLLLSHPSSVPWSSIELTCQHLWTALVSSGAAPSGQLRCFIMWHWTGVGVVFTIDMRGSSNWVM